MTIDREELRRLCEAATPGPWALETVKTSVGTCHKIGKFPSLGAHGETSACVYADSIHEHDIGRSKVGDELLANARLMSAARTVLPALLDALEAAEAREKRLRDGLKAVADLINDSHGVVGLHLNGDIARWEELRTGGYMEEWLGAFDAALEETAP